MYVMPQSLGEQFFTLNKRQTENGGEGPTGKKKKRKKKLIILLYSPLFVVWSKNTLLLMSILYQTNRLTIVSFYQNI